MSNDLSNGLSRTLDWMFSWGGLEAQRVCKSGRGFACPRGSCPLLMRAKMDSCARSLLPLPGCGAISFSLQTKTARCYKQYYCVANKTNNLVDGITFGHMVHFLKYFFVLSLFPHSSHTFDFWLPLKSKLISLNTFMTSGWGVQTGFVSHPAKQVALFFPPSMTQVYH